jgi:hypothetical protein
MPFRQPSRPPEAAHLLLLLVGIGRLLLQMRLRRRRACCCTAAASGGIGNTSGAAPRCCSATTARTAAGTCISGSTNCRRLSRLLLLLRVCLALWVRVVALRWRLQLQCCTWLWLRLLGGKLGCHKGRRGVGEQLAEAGLCRVQTSN